MSSTSSSVTSVAATALSASSSLTSLSGLQSDESDSQDLEFAFRLIREKQFAGSNGGGLVALTSRLADLVADEAKAIRDSKSKDYARGDKIIPDYSLVQPSLEEDDTVRAADAFALRVRESLTGDVDVAFGSPSKLVQHSHM
jgi:hypothetical protein